MSQVAHKIALRVFSALIQGKTENLLDFQKRVQKAASEVTIYTHMLLNKNGTEKRMETPGEAINRFIREIDNPVYNVLSIEQRQFNTSY